MTERRFQLGLSAVLLAGTAWYAMQMASYASTAGRVPLIVAMVMGAALVLQIVGQWRARQSTDSKPAPAPARQHAAEDAADPLSTAEHRAHEVEEEASSGFDVLLALDKVGRNRLIAIFLFSVLFYVGSLLVGFVVTTGVLIIAFMLVAREKVWISVLTGAVSAASVYALVAVVLDLPALHGHFF